jgi:N-acylglucosamine-6-phosphate 2-epimerase
MTEPLKYGLVVSCQAEGDSPFNNVQSIVAFARAAEMGGAIAVRINGTDHIRHVREAVRIPIIGLVKSEYPTGEILITGTLEEVDSIIKAGADIVATDGTYRARPNGLTGTAMLLEIKKRFDIPIIADISTLDEGIDALESGADYAATTLSGYTRETANTVTDEPDYQLLYDLAQRFPARVVAEGRVWTPGQAAHALKLGAHAVVVGTAITRPVEIVRRFVHALRVP